MLLSIELISTKVVSAHVAIYVHFEVRSYIFSAWINRDSKFSRIFIIFYNIHAIFFFLFLCVIWAISFFTFLLCFLLLVSFFMISTRHILKNKNKSQRANCNIVTDMFVFIVIIECYHRWDMQMHILLRKIYYLRKELKASLQSIIHGNHRCYYSIWIVKGMNFFF